MRTNNQSKACMTLSPWILSTLWSQRNAGRGITILSVFDPTILVGAMGNPVMREFYIYFLQCINNPVVPRHGRRQPQRSLLGEGESNAVAPLARLCLGSPSGSLWLFCTSGKCILVAVTCTMVSSQWEHVHNLEWAMSRGCTPRRIWLPF